MHKLLKLFIGLNIFDLIITDYVLEYSGITNIYEMNTFVSKYFDSLGILGTLIIVKFLAICLVIVLFNLSIKYDKYKMIIYTLALMNAFYVGVAINNLYILIHNL